MHAKAAYSWFSRIQGSSPRELPSDADTRRRLCGILQDLGLDIADYSIIPDSDHKSPAAFLVHSPYEGCTYELPWEEESMGTKKLLSLLPSILTSLDDGSLMMADDLDCILHPHALRYLIALYANRERNPHNAQLLFTAHNTAILQPAQMRRDEIWLCCRQEGQDTELYPLSSYKKENGLIPRNDEATASSIWKVVTGPCPIYMPSGLIISSQCTDTICLLYHKESRRRFISATGIFNTSLSLLL